MLTLSSLRSQRLTAVMLLAVVSFVPQRGLVADENGSPAESAKRAETLFSAEVLPTLRKRCFGCHGEGKTLEGGLDMRSRDAMAKGGDSGPALVAGQPEESLLFQAVIGDGERVMPPKKADRLTAAEIDALRRWIVAGAPWVEPMPGGAVQESKAWNNGGEGVVISTSGGLSPDWTHRRYDPGDVWAFQPVRRYAVPWESLGGEGASEQNANPIDAFIAASLAQQGLKAAPPADARTLVRRLSFDLTGLPPSPAEVESFVKDTSAGAYDALVNRLLESSHYGERMAQHWLDVVRYADTSGFSNDYERPNAWRYRDYVIRSFNADKPYDRFLVEQLAGDELDPDDPELLIAGGFLRMGPWEHTGMSVAAETRQQYLDDVTNAVGVTFLAQGLRCAKCHDHKFDPVPTRDYYRLQACFAPVQFADREVEYLAVENVSGFESGRLRTERLLADARTVLAGLRKNHDQAVAAFLKERGVRSEKELPEAERPERHFGLTRLDMSLEKIYRKRVDYFELELKRYRPYAFSVYTGPPRLVVSNKPVHLMPRPAERKGTVEIVHILQGGALETPGERVSPGVLTAAFGSNDGDVPTAWNTVPEAMHGRRLALARWIASPSNPLTARVMVNRVWQTHFGTGLVETPNNFGKMGGRPSHPELLDWLATWFIEHGWSVKKLHRLIVSSDTYRRTGEHPQMERVREVDPNNRLLAYFPPRRLSAEELRDAMLAVSGELNPERGGPGVFPEINWEVARQPRHIMGSVAPAYQPSATPEERNRRTIYAFRYRTLPDPLLEVLNRPGSEHSCERRDETTVTPQAFTLFNGQFAHDRALALAGRLMKDTPDPAARVDRAFSLTYSRAPTDEERRLCLDHVERMTAHHRGHQPVEVPLPESVTREMVEELTGETFEWTEELDVLKAGYQRDLKPWDVGPEVRGLAELCLVLLNSNEFAYVR
ncbi:MAG: PSD1 and planctomycete cytochrome C domain-containing protein [Planctomycetes bacterium]|nr:PSD1 and planctomycete cytochrome C domain-containing protein [Planctomycetota bacterium]